MDFHSNWGGTSQLRICPKLIYLNNCVSLASAAADDNNSNNITTLAPKKELQQTGAGRVEGILM